MNDSASSISLPRRLYHRFVPQRTQDWTNRQIRTWPLWLGRVRWLLSTSAGRERFARRRLNLDEREWVIMLGVNNSGTTLLIRLLGMHPFIRDPLLEGQAMTSVLPRPARLGVERLWTRELDSFRWTEHDDPAPALRCKFDWSYFYPPGRGYMLEKSPPNTVRSRWMQANFAPARFLYVTRHPYAVCEGITRRKRQYTIEDAAHHWATANRIALEDMPHLDKVLRVTYEQLCDNTMAVLHDIETFLELPEPFDRDVIATEFNVHNMDDQPAVIRNFNEQSFSRLSESDKRAIDRIAGDVMQELGYEPLSLSTSAI